MGRGLTIRRGDVVQVKLDPSVRSEIQKTRPCVVVSPDELNARLLTVVVVPMTSVVRNFPHRTLTTWRNRTSSIATDQIRAVDRQRILSRSGALPPDELAMLLARLADMFAP